MKINKIVRIVGFDFGVGVGGLLINYIERNGEFNIIQIKSLSIFYFLNALKSSVTGI